MERYRAGEVIEDTRQKIRASGLRWPQFHQVAIYAPEHNKALDLFKGFGCETWSHDTAYLVGCVGEEKEPRIVRAQMSFNYIMLAGLELEIVTYPSLNSHHHERGPHLEPFLSHMSTHVMNVDNASSRWADVLDVPVIHRFETYNHSNPAIAGKKRFREAILGTRDSIGFDLKFIQRLTEGPFTIIPE